MPYSWGNWLLPEGLADVLPAEARRIEELRRELLDLYRTYGFELVAPPLVEYNRFVTVRHGQRPESVHLQVDRSTLWPHPGACVRI
ncbi:ATP phosphoribosyltransferase regulatory subunit [Bordetella holmesii]|uniref:ATP phosphoribosyltransferase regulatory subunit n=1 Tax=Bordetella holmesii TaxID=35814 RepID=UPI0022A8CC77|nr:ATP phosphoribosyltransferase regulatory subunit [Bordetella holmesii]